MPGFEITGPDGNIYAFPEGTDREVMRAAMTKRFPKQPEPGLEANVEDAGRSFARGAGRGVFQMAGAPADLGGLAQSGVDALQRWSTGLPQEELERRRGAPVISKEALQNAGSEALIKDAAAGKGALPALPGLDYKPKTALGEAANTAGEMLPNMLAGPGGLARRFIQGVAVPTAGAETAHAAAEKYAPSWEPYSRAIGAVGGSLLGAAAGRIATPHPATPEHLRNVGVLDEHGVPMTAGQRSGSTGLKYIESELGQDRFPGQVMEDQKRTFTAEALRTAGADADHAYPQVMQDNATRLGNEFTDLAAHNAIDMNNGANNLRILDVMRRRGPDLSETERNSIVNLGQHIFQSVDQNGYLPGEMYQSLRTRIREMTPDTGKTAYGNTLRDLRRALDDSMESSIAASNPADLGRWQQANRHWGNMKTQGKPSPPPAKTGPKGSSRQAARDRHPCRYRTRERHSGAAT
jgi:hypothetical protein